MIRIITLANKPSYLPDAIASVLAQTRKDIVHVVGLDDGSRDWGGRYPPGVFYSEEARRADMSDYVCWLSDDDILLPNYCEVLANYLDAHPRVHCVYGISRVEMHAPGRKPVLKMVLPKRKVGLVRFDANNLPGFKLDSGQFMIRRSALERVPYPYAPPTEPRRDDGYLLNNIARHVAFWPVNEVVMVNRVTPQSSHRRNVGGKYAGHDWKNMPKYGGG
jgi:GT2 family glycosyltransferase